MPPHAPGRRRIVSLVIAVARLWPLALVAWIFWLTGRVGFNPTDEGFVLAQSHRLLLGEVPHRDFISPRPLGSALFHLVDFAVPLPLFEASRLCALVEVAAYSLLLAALTYGRSPARWGVISVVTVASAILVNLHGFPLMAWYTIDGLFFTAAGLVLVEAGVGRGRRGLVRLGLLCLGCAPVMKQSFFLAPVLGLVRLLVAAWPQPWRGRIAALRQGLLAGMPAAAYVAVIAALGGLEPMRAQALGADPVWGWDLISVFQDATSGEFRRTLGVVGVLLLATSALRIAARRAHQPLALLTAATLTAPAVLSAVILWVAIGHGLSVNFDGGTRLLWVLALVVMWRFALERRADGVGLAHLAVGWMAALSWGYANPNLVAGSLALCALDRVWADVGQPVVIRSGASAAFAGGAVLAAALTAWMFVDARRLPYRDWNATALTVPLGPVSPALGGIQTNPITAEYIQQTVACVRRYPARWVAVLPDNAWLYPALSLDNPFPLDWPRPREFRGSEWRLTASAERLRESGDYLVLFQTFAAVTLMYPRALQPATKESEPYFNGMTRSALRLLETLGGTRVLCGTFIGAYAPAPPPPPLSSAGTRSTFARSAWLMK